MKLALLKAGSTLPEMLAQHGDFEAMFGHAFGLEQRQLMVFNMDRDELPDVSSPANGINGVVVMGSNAMITNGSAWIEATAAWLRGVVKSRMPVLGICFGHQLLAHAMGGGVQNNPAGVEVGSVEITMLNGWQDDPLLTSLPNTFIAQVSHTQSVISLPAGAVSMARSEMEPNHAFRAGERAWGIQFHPEFDLAIVQGYVESRRELLQQEGRYQLVVDALQEAPASRSVLERFLKIL